MLERGGLRDSPFQPAIREKGMLHRTFKVLADPTRLRSLNLPIKAPLCVCDLEYVLQLPQSLISCQVVYLKIAGLVDGSSPRHASAVTRSVLAPRIKQGLENFVRHALSLDETCQELARSCSASRGLRRMEAN